MLELKNINKSFGRKQVLKDINLTIKEGEMLAIVGASGSGKSTLLNIIGFIEDSDSGFYRFLDETDVKANSNRALKLIRHNINYLFQNYALIDSETVEYNLRIALEYTDYKRSKKKDLLARALEEVGLSGYEKYKIYELSGGEQQRVAVARSMLKPGQLVLADEPTGSLDSENRDMIINLLKKMNQDGKTLLIVTHDPIVANSCSRILNLDELV